MKEKLRETVVRKHASVVLTLFLLLLIAGCGDTNNPNSAITTAQTATTTQQGGQNAVSLQQTGTQLTAPFTRPVQTPFVTSDATATDITNPTNSGTGVQVHADHASQNIACKTCHLVGGVVQFDPAGPAVMPGTYQVNSAGKVTAILNQAQVPTYDPTHGTCSNIYCHWVKPGTFTYYDNSLGANNTVPYGTPLPATTPDWYSTAGPSASCTGCHGYPPYTAPNQYVWHSSWHGGVNINSSLNPDFMQANYCSTCHPDVHTVVNGTIGTAGAQLVTTITNPSMHNNGVVNVDESGQGYGSCVYCHGF